MVESPANAQHAGTHTVIVVDRDLGAGFAANAAAILALSLGAARPQLPGPDWLDGAGVCHPGLFPVGLPILGGRASDISKIRRAAVEEHEVLVIDFPADGQTTTDYQRFRQLVAEKAPDELQYAGIALHGPADVVRALTRRLSLLR